ncbi:RNA-directed DNA polymerase [Bacillus thuringiensis]|uniref:reverse transcriptase family protein n=1 Tax=Bacillus thuringiensis TaxID=1428 RepID=UPI00187423A4|nr:reverse transcriptase family protein [Bacillus thuringiensis]MBE5090623.1 RNA-directed DNA polymerase [Bacillus thuringiensis]
MKIYKVDYFERQIMNNEYSTEDLLDVFLKKEEHYNLYVIPKKKNRGTRKLYCLSKNKELYRCQQLLKVNFFDRIPVSDYCYGYRTGKCYKNYLEPHIGKKYFLRLDIKDFFDCIGKDIIRDFLLTYVSEDIENTILGKEISFGLLDLITELVTINGHLPQGAITSPVISNLIFRSLDIRIYRYCCRYGITYSRYADDLLFSSENSVLHKNFFTNKIQHILKSGQYNFDINYRKVKKCRGEISLNGFVVGENVRLSRTKIKKMNTIIHVFKKEKDLDKYNILIELKKNYNLVFENVVDLNNFLSGYRSFLIGILPFNSLGELPNNINRYDTKNLRIISEIEGILEKVNK